jgi:hypothetical protein
VIKQRDTGRRCAAATMRRGGRRGGDYNNNGETIVVVIYKFEEQDGTGDDKGHLDAERRLLEKGTQSRR